MKAQGINKSTIELGKMAARIGGRTVEGRRNPWFQLIQFLGKKTVDRNLK